MFCRYIIPWRHTHFQSHILHGVGKFMISLRIMNETTLLLKSIPYAYRAKLGKISAIVWKGKDGGSLNYFKENFVFQNIQKHKWNSEGSAHIRILTSEHQICETIPLAGSWVNLLSEVFSWGQNTPHGTRSAWDTKRSIVSFEWQVTSISNVRVGHLIPLIWLTDWLSDYILRAEIFHMCEIARCLF